MLADMLKSSLTKIASQLKSSSGGQVDSESTQNVPSDQEKDQNVPSDQEKNPSDHDDRSEVRDLASVEDLTEAPGDPNPKLENLVTTEEEERDFETFTLASLNALKSKTLWRASRENTRYSPAQQVHRQDDLFTSRLGL